MNHGATADIRQGYSHACSENFNTVMADEFNYVYLEIDECFSRPLSVTMPPPSSTGLSTVAEWEETDVLLQPFSCSLCCPVRMASIPSESESSGDESMAEVWHTD